MAIFLVEKGVDKTPLLELRFKCKIKPKTQKVGLVMSVFILAKTTENKNFYDENGILETGTGEILTDIGRNGKERPWKLHKEEGLKLGNLLLQQKAGR